MLKAKLILAILAIFCLASIAIPSSAYNVVRTSNNHFCSSTANCIYWSQTFYANELVEGGDINFTAVSFSPTQVPSHTFGMNVTGGNLTLTQINAPNIVMTTSVGTVENSTIFTDGNTISEVDIGTEQIFSAAFYTSYASWFSATGNAVFQGNGYITMKIPTSSTVTVWFGLVDVTLNLVHANTGPALTTPDYILVNYQKGGTAETLQAEDGANYFTSDYGASITISGISGNPNATMRFCLLGCQNVFVQPNSFSDVISQSYWTQYNPTVQYSAANTLGGAFASNPLYAFYFAGLLMKSNYLSTIAVNQWIDAGSIVTPQQSWYDNGVVYSASPSSVTLTLSNQAILFAYGTTNSTNVCKSASVNTTSLFTNQCLAPAIVYTYADIVTLPAFYSFCVALCVIPVYKKGNLLLTLTTAMIIAGALVSAFGLLSIQIELLIWAGIVFTTAFVFVRLYKGRASGT